MDIVRALDIRDALAVGDIRYAKALASVALREELDLPAPLFVEDVWEDDGGLFARIGCDACGKPDCAYAQTWAQELSR